MKDDGLPKKLDPKSRTQLWREANRDRYNEYQRNYMKTRRAAQKRRDEERLEREKQRFKEWEAASDAEKA